MRSLVVAGMLLALPSAAEARQVGAMTFAPCELKAPRVTGGVKAECARFEVPEDPAAPQGRRISLRVALVPSRADAPATDPVVFLAGGPGQSALDGFPLVYGAFRPLLSRRHVLLVEQRGTGQSSPLRCALPDWKRPGAWQPAATREQARSCLAALERKADPRHYRTVDYLRDLEAVREALGIVQLNVAGGSYGTRVALDYLRRYPQSVRSVFVDSVVPPELALGQDHARNLDEALSRISSRCSADAACRARFGDLGGRLREMKRQLARSPQTVTFPHPQTNAPVSAPFGVPALTAVARIFSYAPRAAALLPLLVSEAAAGRPEPLMAQAELMMSSLGDELAHGMELSVICAEDADLLEVDPRDRDTLMGADFAEFIHAQCSVWPHGARPADFKQPVVSDTPVLLLSGEYDPVTPPRYADQVARTLSNSRHLVAPGQGHTPMGVGCLPRLLREFIETLQPKALDANCLDVLGDTPFFLDYQGPAP